MRFKVVVFIAIGLFSSKAYAQLERPHHIILIGSDGLGAYAFSKAKMPNIRKLMNEGAFSLKARSVLPSSSAVNWMSMLSGTPPEIHGYTEWGSKTPEIPSTVIGKGGIYPTLFSLLEHQRPEVKKGVAYVWEGIGYLFESDYVDMNFQGDRSSVLSTSIKFITKEKPYFTFIHFSEPDGAGHEIGHDTPEYYQAVQKIDTAIGELLAALEDANLLDKTMILISSDHGGIDKGHGGKTMVEMEIPWIIWGAGLKSRGVLSETIITYDTAATLAYIMGLEMPQSWRGQPLKELFDKQ